MLTHAMIDLASDSATLLTIPATGEIDYAKSLSISIQNLSDTNVIFLGDSTVTSSSYGYRIDVLGGFAVDIAPGDEIYAVCDAEPTQVAIIWIQS